MFLGTYLVRFSGKSRIILPKKLRAEIKGNTVVLTKGLDGCIWGFSQKDWLNVAKAQLEIPINLERGRNLRRSFFSAAEISELDQQGRFVIPSTLLIFAQLVDEVIIAGAGDHFEIWNPKLWKKVINEVAKDF